MLEEGWDPDELDQAVEAAEAELAEEAKEKQKAVRRRQAVRNF